MKQILAFLILLLVAAGMAQWPAPTALQAYSSEDDRIVLEWTPPEPIVIADTLYYDAGVGGRGIAMDSGMCALRFSPTSACSVLALRINFYVPFFPDRSINFDMWGVNAYGLPDLADNVFPTTFFNIEGGWNEMDISLSGLIIDRDDFFVRVSKGDTLPYLDIMVDDETDTLDPRSFQYHYMYGWRALPGDLMIRMIVLYLDTREIVTLHGSFGKTFHTVDPFSDLIKYMPPPAPRGRPASPLELITPDEYRIYRSGTYGGGFSSLITVPGSLSTYTDNSIMSNHTYYYTIRAEYDSGSAFSPLTDTVAGTAYSGVGVTLYDTLFYDDGSPGAGVGFPDAIIANKFGVDTRCKLLAIDYNISNVGQGIPKFYLDEGGEPGEELLGYSSRIFNSLGWARINVGTENIILDGDFYVGIEMNTALGISLEESRPGHAWDLPPGGVWAAVPDTNYFIRVLLQYSDGTAFYHMYPGWNAISLPIIPEDGISPAALFPWAMGQVFYFEPDIGSYILADHIMPGKGYFVLSNIERSFSLDGVPIHFYNLYNAGPGWDFIGSLSDFSGVDTTHISTTPDTILDSPLHFYYDRSTGLGTYRTRTDFSPGEAYWIYFNEEGLFNISE